MTTYVLAGGCFWCLDAVYRGVKGVDTSLCGYAGDDEAAADYYKVAGGRTNHAEAVQISFDETIISPEVVLGIFFTIHNPTTLNRQGADAGTQYRSTMFYENDEQKATFQAAVDAAQQLWDDPIVTTLEPLDAFYEAEPEHQDYFNNNPANPYCSVIIAPKIIKARQVYAEWLNF